VLVVPPAVICRQNDKGGVRSWGEVGSNPTTAIFLDSFFGLGGLVVDGWVGRWGLGWMLFMYAYIRYEVCVLLL
jgi:hypothetical protein